MSKLLGKNTKDLKKTLNKIKQQNTELKKDERNSANNSNENDKLNMVLSVIDRIYQFSKEEFNKILNIITKAKNNGLKTNADAREITLDNAESYSQWKNKWEVSSRKSTTILLMM